MSDEEKKVVSLVQYRDSNSTVPDKANPALPDHIWEAFQGMGELATAHLARLLADKRFQHFSIKDQMRIIETTFQRAYGSPDGSVKRNIHIHTNPEDNTGFNILSSMSRQAKRKLPEFRSPTHRETLEDVYGGDESVSEHSLDTDSTKNVPGDGDK